MKKYVDGEYITMTPEEVAGETALWETYRFEIDEATEEDYQSALAEFGVKV